MTVLLVLVPLIVCLALLARGWYPGERRIGRALERALRRTRRTLPRTPSRTRDFAVAVRGTVRGRAPPACLL